MKIEDKIQTALDESRMLILGAQIFVGFQFQCVFQEEFDRLPAWSRRIDGVAIVLMVLAIALLIAPSVHHRIIYRGNDTGAIHRVITTMSALSLLPFAVSLGLGIFVALERIAGPSIAAAAGALLGFLAVLFWYGIEYIRAKSFGHKERAMSKKQQGRVDSPPLHTRIEQLLTEARVILPGAQALLGFQFAIVLTAAFDRLPRTSQIVHGASLALVAFTAILLMAPAAYHRIVYDGEDSAEFQRTGSLMVTAATVPLALGLSGDVYVAVAKIADSMSVGSATAAGALLICGGLWHIYPAFTRGLGRRRDTHNDKRAAA